MRHSEGRRIARYGTQVMAGYSFISEHATGPRVLFQPDGTSGVITLDMSLWTIEEEVEKQRVQLRSREEVRDIYTKAKPPFVVHMASDIARHGDWDKENLRYVDGEKSHPCGYNCSVGVP